MRLGHQQEEELCTFLKGKVEGRELMKETEGKSQIL